MSATVEGSITQTTTLRGGNVGNAVRIALKQGKAIGSYRNSASDSSKTQSQIHRLGKIEVVCVV